MKIRQIHFHPNFIEPIRDGIKRVTRRPFKIQPNLVDFERGFYLFGEGQDEYRIYFQDLPCPYGEPGELLQMHAEGNPIPFHEAKVIEYSAERLSQANDPKKLRLEGCPDWETFLQVWNEIYGETEFASIFDPYVWVIKF